MNSDPYDSAAWRSFDMLDSDESAIFNEAMLHDPVLRGASLEMDRLAAAIAATTAVPIDPGSAQLARVQARLGLAPAKSAPFWFAISGWATAAVLAVLLALQLTGFMGHPSQGASAAAAALPAPSPLSNTIPSSNNAPPVLTSPGVAADQPRPQSSLVPSNEIISKPPTKVETKRLAQEIEVLRDNLEKFQNRDRVLFEVVPGMALPIVMTMSPPGITAEDPAFFTKNDEHSPLTTLLGDALTSLTGASSAAPSTMQPPDAHAALSAEHAAAIPIYDAARDAGTLVVSKLPPVAEGEVYNLWVTTQTGGQPIYVGTLPENSASGADSFDFSLGSTMVIPSGFILTRDPDNAPASPTAANTILQGPPAPVR